MPLITWDDSIAVGISSLDQQHQRWVGFINELHDAMMERRGKDVVAGTLKRVSDYMRTHFANEEQLMVRHGYPGYARHKQLHDEFVAKMAGITDPDRPGGTVLTLDVMDALRDWLVNHIQRVDREYVAHLKAKGVQ